MNADEYETRLRMRVAAEYLDAATSFPDSAYPRLEPAFQAALDAYADWLRLRAVAKQPCAFKFVREFVKRIEAERWFPSLPDPPGQCECPSHEAQQKLDAILAAAEGGTG